MAKMFVKYLFTTTCVNRAESHTLLFNIVLTLTKQMLSRRHTNTPRPLTIIYLCVCDSSASLSVGPLVPADH